MELPAGPFDVVCADPPWSYEVFSDKGKGRSAERHYETQGLDWICSLPVADRVARDAHCFLWITGPCLVRGDHTRVLEAWGFRPSAMAFVWIKSKKDAGQARLFALPVSAADFVKGMGHTTRQNAEFVILGRRGSPKRACKAVHQIIVEPRREHSRKPEVFRDRVETYAGPDARILELFARSTRPGWTSWCNETSKYDEAA